MCLLCAKVGERCRYLGKRRFGVFERDVFFFCVCVFEKLWKVVIEMFSSSVSLSLSLSLSLSPCLSLPPLQANPNELTNGVINSAFMLLFKDSIRLFAAYNEGVINMLGKQYTPESLLRPCCILWSNVPVMSRSQDCDCTQSFFWGEGDQFFPLLSLKVQLKTIKITYSPINY